MGMRRGYFSGWLKMTITLRGMKTVRLNGFFHRMVLMSVKPGIRAERIGGFIRDLRIIFF